MTERKYFSHGSPEGHAGTKNLLQNSLYNSVTRSGEKGY